MKRVLLAADNVELTHEALRCGQRRIPQLEFVVARTLSRVREELQSWRHWDGVLAHLLLRETEESTLGWNGINVIYECYARQLPFVVIHSCKEDLAPQEKQDILKIAQTTSLRTHVIDCATSDKRWDLERACQALFEIPGRPRRKIAA